MEEVAHQQQASAADGVAQGQVVDRNKEPLPYVTIRVVGKETVGVSNIDGKFYIKDVTPDDVLEFSYVGMATVRHKAGNKPLVVIMEEDNILEDVVVTGIFPKRKDAYTGAVTTITSEELKNFGNKNLITSIGNIDPAFNILTNNELGSNPNRLPEIQIRGNANLPALDDLQDNTKTDLNTPLIVLDGFEISLERLMDPNDDDV